MCQRLNPTKVFGILIILLLSASAHSQTSQKIEILGADALKLDTLHHGRKLVGNVRLKQDEVTMTCDSALFYNKVNGVDAFGHVRIFDSQTNVHSDSLKYDGEKKTAVLYGNVRVIQDSALLETRKLIYKTDLKQAAYYEGGNVTARDMTITSRRGYYYPSTKEAHFSGDVMATGSDYDLQADTLRYNTETEVSYFNGPTEIIRSNEKIYCESGWYDTRTEVSVFGKNTALQSEAQKIWADSLYYDSRTGFGEAYKNFRWTDTTMNAILTGNKAVYYTDKQRITVTDSALLTYLVDDDSLFLASDTLKSRQSSDSLGEYTEFFAFPGVRIFKKNLQGVCDSLAFSFRDSTIRLFKEPVLWSEGNQLTGDTVTILLINEKLDRFELYDNGFITNQAHESELYNQIKGRHILGYFKDKQLDRLLVTGNGESIYYGTDEGSAFIGVNKAVCSNMWIYMKEEQVSRITFLAQPDATFYPIQTINASDFLLNGFKWKMALRPESKADLFGKSPPELPAGGIKNEKAGY